MLLLGVLVFKERAVPRDWLLVAFAAAGVAVILYFESRGASREAVAWGLASGARLCRRRPRAPPPANTRPRLARGDQSHRHRRVLLVTVCARSPNDWRVPPPHFPTGIQWPLLRAFGIFQMGLPYMLFARGLQRIPGHEATGLGLIEPILVPLWTFLAWNERPAWWTIAGGALILTGLAVRYFEFPKDNKIPVGGVSDAD